VYTVQVDEIQAELLPPMPDAYASLANKLHQMVIEDNPHTKKRRTEVIDLTDDRDEEHRPPTLANGVDEPNHMEEDAASVQPPLKFVRRVSTLVELCIGAPPLPFSPVLFWGRYNILLLLLFMTLILPLLFLHDS
jgi:hypothetical protein